MLGVMLCGLMAMMGRMQTVRVRDMRMMSGLLVIAGCIMLGRLAVMMGCVLMVLGCGMMVVAAFMHLRAHV